MDVIETAIEFLGTSITVVGTLGVIFLGRFIISKSVKDKRALPYHRQFFTLIVFLVGLFVAIALLPLDPDLRSQILSVLGILLSAIIALSSTTLVGNAMAGIMLRLMKGLRAGDFIEFDQFIGRVTDIGLFHTEMQLITRDIVTVPNTVLSQTPVRVTRRAGTFVNATLSIGYDESHTKVAAALRKAAESIELTEPFVLVDDLLDHAVQYQVYGLLEDSSELLTKRSHLRKAILDTLHDEGIEIMSPSIIDRREHGADHRFVPEAGEETGEESTDAEEEGQVIEEVAFDRAEEAESIEQLYAQQEKLNHDLKDGSENAAAKERLEAIEAEIKKREEAKEKQRLDENSSD